MYTNRLGHCAIKQQNTCSRVTAYGFGISTCVWWCPWAIIKIYPQSNHCEIISKPTFIFDKQARNRKKERVGWRTHFGWSKSMEVPIKNTYNDIVLKIS